MSDELNELVIGDEPKNSEVSENKNTSNPNEVVITEEAVNQSVKTIQEVMFDQERRNSKTQMFREALVDHMTPFILDMELDTKNKSYGASFQDKSMLLANFTALLNDIDNSDKNMVSSRLKLKDIETNSKRNETNAAEFLSQMRKLINEGKGLNNIEITQPTAEEIDSKMDEVTESNDLKILDTELSMGGTMLPKEGAPAPKLIIDLDDDKKDKDE